jgi:phage shock protein PspC (stress-responsive transcriptional regulator)
MSRPTIDRIRARFFLDPANGWIAGVCAGIAHSLGTDPAFLRVAFVLTGLFLPKVAIGAYLVAWILLDARRDTRRR